jgi:hypothetical protein
VVHLCFGTVRSADSSVVIVRSAYSSVCTVRSDDSSVGIVRNADSSVDTVTVQRAESVLDSRQRLRNSPLHNVQSGSGFCYPVTC